MNQVSDQAKKVCRRPIPHIDLIDELPDDANWDGVLAKTYERRMIEAGVADSEAGRATPVEALRRKCGLSD